MTTLTTPRYLSLHLLETVNGVPLPGGDDREPKTIAFGGVMRHYISSQARRRAERLYMRRRAERGLGPLSGRPTARRSRQWPLQIARVLERDHGWEWQEALDITRAVLIEVGFSLPAPNDARPYLFKTLVYAPSDAGARVAALLTEDRDLVTGWHHAREDDPAAALPKPFLRDLVRAFGPRDSIEIALFGSWMPGPSGTVLDSLSQELTVEGALQSAHAIGVHEYEATGDYAVAVDDEILDRRRNGTEVGEAGAAWVGDRSLVSATFYRHATIDRLVLRHHLRGVGLPDREVDELMAAAEAEFAHVFVDACPTKSFGVLPDLVLAHEGERPISYASAFQKPIKLASGGATVTERAVERLLSHHRFTSARRDDLSAGRVLTYAPQIEATLQAQGEAVEAVEQVTAPVG